MNIIQMPIKQIIGFHQLFQGGQKAKKRVTYENDGWQCDVCSNTQTSLRRNGPNNIRMCTACYSKMQREKKKGSTDGMYSERMNSDDIVIDTHPFNVRGSRHASAAARKFIEEFARNKGGWEKANGSHKRSCTYDEELMTPQHSSRATQDVACTVLTTNLSVPKGTSAELFHLARSCCAIGNKILRRDGSFSTQPGFASLSESSRSHYRAVDQAKLNMADSGPFRFSSARSPAIHSFKHQSEQPDVLQGAADLLHMMKEQSRRACSGRQRHGVHDANQHDPSAPDNHRPHTSIPYPCTGRADTSVGCGGPLLGSSISIDGCARDFSFSSRSTPRHLIRGVHGRRPGNSNAISQPFLALHPTAYRCSRSDVA